MFLIKRILKLIFFKIKYFRNAVIICNNCNISLNSSFAGNNKINSNTSISSSFIDKCTYIGSNCMISFTKIGKYCSIANNVKVIVGNHPVHGFVSTHPSFFSLRKQSGFTYVNKQKFEEIKYVDTMNKYSVIIGNDVWIGEDVKILGGVSIGDGAIIGAGSIITKDVEPYSINVGVPSKKIDLRFNDDDINFLLNFKWWDKDEKWINNNCDMFEDIKKFKEEFK